MPRTDTTPRRRAKRDSQSQLRTSLPNRLSSSSKSTTNANDDATPKVKVKTEYIPTSIPPSPTITIPARKPSQTQTWRHPDELRYIRNGNGGDTWDDMTIVRFLRDTAVSVPPRPSSTQDPFVIVRCANPNSNAASKGNDAEEVRLPRGYRLPLLWLQKFLWLSVPIIFLEHNHNNAKSWHEDKFDLLHVARLCATLLASAREAAGVENGGSGMDRGWRCASFDRALRRYWRKWLNGRDEFVRDFWREFEEEEFEGDVLKLNWSAWVLRGHQQYKLTKEEADNGISAAEFTGGLVIDEENGTFAWVDPSSAVPVQVTPQVSVPLPPPAAVVSAPVIPIPAEPVSTRRPPITAATAPPAPLPAPPPAQIQSKAEETCATPREPPPVTVRPKEKAKSKPRSTTKTTTTTTAGVAKAIGGGGGAAGGGGEVKHDTTVCGSISLASLVSRIPPGGGRHRSTSWTSVPPIAVDTSVSVSVDGYAPMQVDGEEERRMPPPDIGIGIGAGTGRPGYLVSRVLVPVDVTPRKGAVLSTLSLPYGAPLRTPFVAAQARNMTEDERGDPHPEESNINIKQEEDIPRIADPDSFSDLDDSDCELLYPESESSPPKIFPLIDPDTTTLPRTRAHSPLSPSRQDAAAANSNSSPVSESLFRSSPSPAGQSFSTAHFPLPENGDNTTDANANASINLPSTGPDSHHPASSHIDIPTTTPFTFTPVPSSSSASPSTQSQSQLIVPPATTHTHALQQQQLLSPLADLAAEPNLDLLARLTQSWNELRSEVGALRAELQLHGHGAPRMSANVEQLEARVRRLEEDGHGSRSGSQSGFGVFENGVGLSISAPLARRRGPRSSAASSSSFSFDASRHPLQHLIDGDGDVPMMDVVDDEAQ
ncbi:hypothetical protein R3P38DRAFT_3255831 [Favolaschia claudopus]|uniref:Uncharacterized protein n=1 Tax=Favolaschia claudopus TaxID=2862362 RepID=A0AAW0DP58_9AGAR